MLVNQGDDATHINSVNPRLTKGSYMKLRDDEVKAIRDKAEMEFRTGNKYVAWRDADSAGIVQAHLWVPFQHSYPEITPLNRS